LWWLFATNDANNISNGKNNEQDNENEYNKENKNEFELDDIDYHLIEKHLSEIIKPEDTVFGNLSAIPEEKSEEENNLLSDIIEEKTEEIEEFESENDLNENSFNYEIEIYHIKEEK